MNVYANAIIEAIKANQNAEKALWLENYVKHDIKSLGVGIPEIREILKRLEQDTALTKPSNQVEFLNDLMKNEYTEPKLAAILYLQLNRKTINGSELLEMTSNWFSNEWITDWNVCDWLCVRLLTPLLDKEPEIVLPTFNDWNKSPNLWKARASLVPFAQSKDLKRHSETIRQFSTELIMRPERFCKTAVGWVMREYSKIDATFVTEFLEAYSFCTTKEVIKNATKYVGH